MNISGIIGLLIGLIAILSSQFFETGSISIILQPSAALIVIGGTLGATFLNFSIPTVLRAFKMSKKAFFDSQEETVEIVEDILQLAILSRDKGILALQNILYKITDPFLQRGVQLSMDITSPQLLQEILNMEIELDEEQELIYSRVFEALGGYAPTFGIIGAVLGLIQVMSNLQDPQALGQGVAIAFVATLYGVGLANLVFLPIAGNLKMKLREKIMLKEMIVHGLISIQMNENPAIIQEKLLAFLDFNNRQHTLSNNIEH